MKVTVYNFKGGVGKSTIALNYALTQDYYIVTTDVYNRVDKVMPEGRGVILELEQDLPDFPDEYSIVFDIGGTLEPRAIKAMKQSKAVIVPIVARMSELEVTMASIQEIRQYHENLIIVVNQPKKGHVETIEEIFAASNLDYPILPLQTSAVLERIRQTGLSLRGADSASSYAFRPYAKPVAQFDRIIEEVEK